MFRKLVLLASLLVLFATPSWAAPMLFSQPYDGQGSFWASQNDTAGNGNFASMWDDFMLADTATVTEMKWWGGYWNPGKTGNITSWQVTFAANNGGIPGGSLATYTFPGDGNEAVAGGAYGYDVTGLGFVAIANTRYWVSVVPDIGFPPQWGWGTSTVGGGDAYQIYFGSGYRRDNNMAFELDGSSHAPIPEPATLLLFGTGLVGAARRGWRKK